MTESLRQALNRADPNALADMLRGANLGDVLRALPVYLRSQTAGVTGACAQQLSTLGTVVLPEDAKAATISRCTVKASGVANGEFTIVAYGTTPTTTQCAVAPNGDIVFLGSDAVTSADIIYTPQKGDVLGNSAGGLPAATAGQLTNSTQGNTSLTLPAPAAVMVIPSAYSGKAILLMQALANVATITGQKIILVPATGVTATTKAALSQDATKVYFNTATDVVTNVTVDLLVASGAGPSGPGNGVDINALLEAAPNYT